MFEFLFFMILVFSGVVFSLLFYFIIKFIKINPVYIVFLFPILFIIILFFINVRFGLFILSSYLFSLPIIYYLIPKSIRHNIENLDILKKLKCKL